MGDMGYRDAQGRLWLMGRKSHRVLVNGELLCPLAAEGMVGVVYSTTEPEVDLYTVMEFLDTEAQRLGVDETRVAVWSASANASCACS